MAELDIFEKNDLQNIHTWNFCRIYPRVSTPLFYQLRTPSFSPISAVLKLAFPKSKKYLEWRQNTRLYPKRIGVVYLMESRIYSLLTSKRVLGGVKLWLGFGWFFEQIAGSVHFVH
jgi:hypothetical protein